MASMGGGHVHETAVPETTEWQDILRATGVIPPSAASAAADAAAVLEAAADVAAAALDAPEARLARASLAELDEAAEEEGGDRGAIESFRRARIAALKAAAARNRFGRVYPLSRADFVREVTDASKAAASGGGSAAEAAAAGDGTWVVVLLYKSSIESSRLLESLLPRLADAHPATKFMQIVADQCIDGFPDRNVPALLLYFGGECREQIYGLSSLGGMRASAATVEWVLARHGALATELEEDPRKALESGGSGGLLAARGGGGGRRRGGGEEEEDDD
jgi:hypothetical protein